MLQTLQSHKILISTLSLRGEGKRPRVIEAALKAFQGCFSVSYFLTNCSNHSEAVAIRQKDMPVPLSALAASL